MKMSKEEILEKDLKIETEDKDVDEASKSIVLKDLKNIFDEASKVIVHIAVTQLCKI